MDERTLAARQSLPLWQKVVMTQQKIQEWCDAFEDNVYVSFSGGKDSTVLAHLVEQTVGGGTVPLRWFSATRAWSTQR